MPRPAVLTATLGAFVTIMPRALAIAGWSAFTFLTRSSAGLERELIDQTNWLEAERDQFRVNRTQLQETLGALHEPLAAAHEDQSRKAQDQIQAELSAAQQQPVTTAKSHKQAKERVAQADPPLPRPAPTRVAKRTNGQPVQAEPDLSLRPVLIRRDIGGDISVYQSRIKQWIKERRRIIIDGPCASACTIYLASPHLCITRRAQFWFHAGYVEFNAGYNFKIPSRHWSNEMLRHYPKPVLNYINRHGGLREMAYVIPALQGNELRQMVRACSTPDPIRPVPDVAERQDARQQPTSRR
jgi:hypothetical protein